jgi:omega-3 fatty acid desaturase (delta-15 desaturase)
MNRRPFLGNHLGLSISIAESPLNLQDGSYDLSAPPPFTLADLRNAIPAHCWEKNTFKSMAYMFLDVGIVAGLAVAAYTLNAW